jgi:hypothetical protein
VRRKMPEGKGGSTVAARGATKSAGGEEGLGGRGGGVCWA